MTKKIFLLQFFSILLIFVLPPIFASFGPGGRNLQADFSRLNVYTLPCAALAAFLCLQDKNDRQEEEAAGGQMGGEKAQNAGGRLWRLLELSGHFLLAFGLLTAAACAARLVLIALGIGEESLGPAKKLPQSASGWAACAFTLFAAALYEESLYRLYLPKAFRGLIKPKADASPKIRAAATFLAEALPLVLFALAHAWQGVFAVFNALFAGVVLRLCFVRAKSILPPFLAHLLYNAAALAMAAGA